MRRACGGFQMGAVWDYRLRVRVCLQHDDHLGGQPQLDSQEAKLVPEKPLFLYNVAQLAPEEQLQPNVMATVSRTSGCQETYMDSVKPTFPLGQGCFLTGPSPEEGLNAQGQRALGHFEVDI